jgi:hypothetical protein
MVEIGRLEAVDRPLASAEIDGAELPVLDVADHGLRRDA